MSMCLLFWTIRRSYGLSLPLPKDMEGEYMGKSALIQLCVEDEAFQNGWFPTVILQY